ASIHSFDCPLQIRLRRLGRRSFPGIVSDKQWQAVLPAAGEHLRWWLWQDPPISLDSVRGPDTHAGRFHGSQKIGGRQLPQELKTPESGSLQDSGEFFACTFGLGERGSVGKSHRAILYFHRNTQRCHFERG